MLAFGVTSFQYVRTAAFGIGWPYAVSRRSPAPCGLTATKFITTDVAPDGMPHPVTLPPCELKSPFSGVVLKFLVVFAAIGPTAERVSTMRHGVTGV
jgi:hypothetical protein